MTGRPGSAGEPTNLLFLWGTPRSMSTAFLRMMLERGDHEVYHEPFSSIVVQGHTTVGERTATSHDELLKLLEERAGERPVFVKETTEYDYLSLGGERIPEVGRHSFIIRDPRLVIPSHYAMNPVMKCSEVGYGHQVAMARRAYAASGIRPLVITAEDLLADPAGAVARYCRAAGIPFVPSALHWQPGDQGVWSRTRQWHRDAAGSSCFADSRRTYAQTVDNNEFLAHCYRQHLPHYRVMCAFART